MRKNERQRFLVHGNFQFGFNSIQVVPQFEICNNRSQKKLYSVIIVTAFPKQLVNKNDNEKKT